MIFFKMIWLLLFLPTVLAAVGDLSNKVSTAVSYNQERSTLSPDKKFLAIASEHNITPQKVSIYAMNEDNSLTLRQHVDLQASACQYGVKGVTFTPSQSHILVICQKGIHWMEFNDGTVSNVQALPNNYYPGTAGTVPKKAQGVAIVGDYVYLTVEDSVVNGMCCTHDLYSAQITNGNLGDFTKKVSNVGIDLINVGGNHLVASQGGANFKLNLIEVSSGNANIRQSSTSAGYQKIRRINDQEFGVLSASGYNQLPITVKYYKIESNTMQSTNSFTMNPTGGFRDALEFTEDKSSFYYGINTGLQHYSPTGTLRHTEPGAFRTLIATTDLVIIGKGSSAWFGGAVQQVVFTRDSGACEKNFKVVGSNNLNIPISIAIPIALAIINPMIGSRFKDFKISF